MVIEVALIERASIRRLSKVLVSRRKKRRSMAATGSAYESPGTDNEWQTWRRDLKHVPRGPSEEVDQLQWQEMVEAKSDTSVERCFGEMLELKQIVGGL